MPSHILGIDLGSWSVKAVLLESTFRGHQVEAVREVPLSPGAPRPAPSGSSRRCRSSWWSPASRPTPRSRPSPGELATTRFVELPVLGSEEGRGRSSGASWPTTHPLRRWKTPSSTTTMIEQAPGRELPELVVRPRRPSAKVREAILETPEGAGECRSPLFAHRRPPALQPLHPLPASRTPPRPKAPARRSEDASAPSSSRSPTRPRTPAWSSTSGTSAPWSTRPPVTQGIAARPGACGQGARTSPPPSPEAYQHGLGGRPKSGKHEDGMVASASAPRVLRPISAER
jgi:hypothetical protein